MPPLDGIEASLTRETDAGDAMATLLGTLKNELDAAIAALPSQTALTALSDKIDANTTKWVAAVVANTPAAPSA
jgi:hypothetical protein